MTSKGRKRIAQEDSNECSNWNPEEIKNWILSEPVSLEIGEWKGKFPYSLEILSRIYHPFGFPCLELMGISGFGNFLGEGCPE